METGNTLYFIIGLMIGFVVTSILIDILKKAVDYYMDKNRSKKDAET